MHSPHETDETRYCYLGKTQAFGRTQVVRRYSVDGNRCRPRRSSKEPFCPYPRSDCKARAFGGSKRNIIISVCLALLVIACAEGLLFAGSDVQGGSSALGPMSTPRSEWRMGELPYLYQIDPQWAESPYAGGTIAENGCGPTCMAMVYACLTGQQDRDPVWMSTFAEREGFSDGGATLWSFMSDGAASLGLHSEEMPADEGMVLSQLRAGHPVVCITGPGDFTTTGHFIVLSEVDDQGRVWLHDPNSEANSHRAWDIRAVLSQCRNLWAFSR